MGKYGTFGNGRRWCVFSPHHGYGTEHDGGRPPFFTTGLRWWHSCASALGDPGLFISWCRQCGLVFCLFISREKILISQARVVLLSSSSSEKKEKIADICPQRSPH